MIINFTQHAATDEQKAAGVVDLEGAAAAELRRLLTFDSLPTRAEIRERSLDLTDLAAVSGGGAVMIGGAPFLMGPLEKALKDAGLKVVYAFSRRESEDQHQPDGSVKKVAVFRHAGFIEA